MRSPVANYFAAFILAALALSSPAAARAATFIYKGVERSALHRKQTFTIRPSLTAPRSIAVVSDLGGSRSAETFRLKDGNAFFVVTREVVRRGTYTIQKSHGTTTIAITLPGFQDIETETLTLAKNKLKSVWVLATLGPFKNTRTTTVTKAQRVQ